MRASQDAERAVSPVVGGVLLVGIVVVLSAVTAVAVLGAGDTGTPAPTARLELDAAGGCEYRLRHAGGDTIDGDLTRVDGVADEDALQGTTFTAGDSVPVRPEGESVRLTWRRPSGAESFVLARFAVAGGGGLTCGDGTVFTLGAGDVRAVAGDGGAVTTIATPTAVEALGPARADLTGDGRRDLPYVDAAGRVRVTNGSNASTTLTGSAAIPGSVARAKTRLWAGRWNGSEASVFFVDQSHEEIYRVNDTGTPVEVAAPGDGAQAVAGAGDVDGDGAAELLFADASQQLRYVEPDGSVEAVDDGGTGSNNGIGAGSVADFDDDGVVSVVTVDGSNDLKIVGEPTGDGGEGVRTVGAVDAKKSPVTVADVDGDDDGEVVYVDTGGSLRYLDDVSTSPTVRSLSDESGGTVGGEDDTGVT